MGAAHRARKTLDRHVAIKVNLPGVTERFLARPAFLAQISSPTSSRSTTVTCFHNARRHGWVEE
jgi:hypothetical protein